MPVPCWSMQCQCGALRHDAVPMRDRTLLRLREDWQCGADAERCTSSRCHCRAKLSGAVTERCHAMPLLRHAAPARRYAMPLRIRAKLNPCVSAQSTARAAPIGATPARIGANYANAKRCLTKPMLRESPKRCFALPVHGRSLPRLRSTMPLLGLALQCPRSASLCNAFAMLVVAHAWRSRALPSPR